MNYDLYASGFQLLHCLIVDGERVAAADVSGGIFMDSLQTKLDPHGFYAIKLFKQV